MRGKIGLLIILFILAFRFHFNFVKGYFGIFWYQKFSIKAVTLLETSSHDCLSLILTIITDLPFIYSIVLFSMHFESLRNRPTNKRQWINKRSAIIIIIIFFVLNNVHWWKNSAFHGYIYRTFIILIYNFNCYRLKI